MNEKIKEIMYECYVPLVERLDDNLYDMEKFAELIIRECYKIAMKEGNGFYCPSDILDHFGIKK